MWNFTTLIKKNHHCDENALFDKKIHPCDNVIEFIIVMKFIMMMKTYHYDENSSFDKKIHPCDNYS